MLSERVIAAGVGRSGTSALAQCLGLVHETHHECLNRFRHDKSAGELQNPGYLSTRYHQGEDVDLSMIPDLLHEVEVGHYYAFMLPTILEGKYIHIWRPFETWLQSAWNASLMSKRTKIRLWRGDTRQERLLAWWTEMNSHLLTVDAYRMRIDTVSWPELFEYLGWDVSDDQLLGISQTLEARPNNGGDYDYEDLPLPESARSLAIDVQLELERVT